VTPAPVETNTVILIQTNNFTDAIIVVDSNTASQDVTVTPFVIPGSSIPPTDFTFEGVRTSVFAQATGAAAANSTSSTTSSAQ